MNDLPLPPEPTMSRLTQTRRLGSDSFRLIEDCRAECGDVFSLRPLGMGRWLVVCSPEALTELFRKKEDEVVAGEVRGSQFGYLIGDNFSLWLDGEAYFTRRRAMQPFLNGRKLLAKTADLREIVLQELSTWPGDQIFAVLPGLDTIGRQVIQRLIFGPGVAPDLDELCLRFFDAAKSPWVYVKPLQWNLPGVPYARFVKAREALFRRLDQEIQRLAAISGTIEADRIEAPQGDESDPESHDDIVSSLLSHLGGADAEQRATVAQEVMGLLIGGAETTSKMIAWVLLDLLETPQVMAKMRAELDEVVGDGELDAGHFRSLTYLDAVVEEGLRFRSPAAFPGMRLTKTDIELAGFRIPAGTTVVQALAQSGLNDHFPSPGEFDPDANQVDRKVADSHAYPFGGGVRRCTGLGLARLEMALVLAEIVRRFDVERVGEGDEPEKDGIAFSPPRGLEVRLRRRPSGSRVGAERDAA